MSESIIKSDQYLIFILDKDYFAVNVAHVREVLDYVKITKVPKTPSFVAGIINLRGKVVPVIDLKNKFEIGLIERTVDTSIIIAELKYEEQTVFIGALVDGVKSVIRFDGSGLEMPPKVGLSIDLSFIESIGRYKDDLVMILNFEKIFSARELSFLAEEMQGQTNPVENG